MSKKNNNKDVRDRIRGSLMAGAAGDALGYPVEFLSRYDIISRHGESGIREFELDENRKALISDDTQMTLFTANSLLTGLTRAYMRGTGGDLEFYVREGYVDWYHTQTDYPGRCHNTWLGNLPEMAYRRAPGNTCLNACARMIRGEKVQNNSKGCGGIMRVAPMGLLMAAHTEEPWTYSLTRLAEAGAEVARVTHKAPLGFLPAALLTVLIYKLVLLDTAEAKASIDDIVKATVAVLDEIFPDEYEHEKKKLRTLTDRAVALAHSDTPDETAIRELGEGWVAEETWAIALYCAVRHIDSVKDAIIAAVNHNGDSDSTGSVCGNIMGAIYGYETIKSQNLFCPSGHSFEDTLELSEITLALADDLSSGCIISEYNPIDTPEKQQWFLRYCEMVPAGIGVTYPRS